MPRRSRISRRRGEALPSTTTGFPPLVRTCAEYHGERAVVSSPGMRARHCLLRAAISLGLSSVAGVTACLWALNANATDCGAPLVSTCIDDDNLWPRAGSSRFLSVGGTTTLEGGQVGFGVVTTYLSRPLTLQSATPGPGGSRDYVIDNQANTAFLWSYGIARDLELDFVLPITLGQSGTGTSPITGAPSQTALSNTATRDLRFGFTYALLARGGLDANSPTQNGLALAARFEMSAPTGDAGEFA